MMQSANLLNRGGVLPTVAHTAGKPVGMELNDEAGPSTIRPQPDDFPSARTSNGGHMRFAALKAPLPLPSTPEPAAYRPGRHHDFELAA